MREFLRGILSSLVLRGARAKAASAPGLRPLNHCRAYLDTAPGAPVSDPAGIENLQKRAGSETGAPNCQSSRGRCQDAPSQLWRPEMRLPKQGLPAYLPPVILPITTTTTM